MRRWTRDRNKRRKQEGEKQNGKPGPDSPAPLQPRFPEPAATEADEDRQPEFEAQPDESEMQEAQPTADTGGGEDASQQVRRDRNRRRGRRGRGSRPQPSQPPTIPGPGGPTGEAGEAEAPTDVAEPAAQPVAASRSKQPKGAVVLSIGLPGSGKSTWFKRHNILPLSSDMVRILLFDDVTEQRYQDLVFSTLRSMVRARLLARRPWNYLDATNLSPHERRSWIKLAHDFGYEVHAVFFDVPPEVCMERNQRRERNVPEDVMQRMATKLRPPKFEEGFAKITVVRLKKKDDDSVSAEAAPVLPTEPELDEPEGAEPPNLEDSEY
jgi:predicted kinase